jgi:hypothetical protein
MTDLQGYKLQYESEFDNAVQSVLPNVQNISQGEKAEMFNVSRRTIIDFEKGRLRNYWLLFCYRMKAYGDAIV